jgi:hypothetical protein
MAAPSVLLKLLESLLVCCRRCGKKVVGAAEKHLQHLESGCKLHLVLTDKDPTPTSHTISASPPDNILTLATRGRPSTWIRVPRAVAGTSDVSPRQATRRTKALNQVREIVSGGDTNKQLQLEVKSLPKASREQLLHDAGFSVHVPAGQGLAMRCDVGLPWNQLRQLRKWLRIWGVQMEGEKKQRKGVQGVEEKVKGEVVPFSFPKRGHTGEELRASALVYLKVLQDHLLQLLDDNNQDCRITWDKGMPEGEVWVKLGGDKGGSCMKVQAQLCNVPTPNSPKNTSVFTAFEAPDTITNLHIALERYKDQVIQLQSLTWSGKRVRVFLSGDYEVLCRMYGLSGASGRHCCLWCEISSDQLRTPLHTCGYSLPRTLDTLKRDHQQFLQSGGNIKHAKNFNNVIQPHMWDIQTDQICLPALHISLGIFYRLYTLLEQAAHQLDLQLAQERSGGELGGETFGEYSQKIEKLHQLTEERDAHVQAIAALEELVPRMALTATSEDSARAQINYVEQGINECRKKAQELDREIDKVKSDIEKGFRMEEGPFIIGLDRALKSFNVQREAYYGGTFVGNHVHRCLKVNIDIIIA